MMRPVLFASALLISGSAFAQTTTPAQTTAPDAATATQDSTTTAPAPVTQPDPATQTAQSTAEAGQPASGDQIAQIVEAEFPKYDKDGKGQLTETQFSEWMVALRSASDPATSADKPEVKAWVRQAFTQADKDKSKAVSKAELTSFLSQSA